MRTWVRLNRRALGRNRLGASTSLDEYLKAGKGEAWAGQVRAIPDPELNKNVEDLENEENLGAAVPTGSTISEGSHHAPVYHYQVPESWQG